MTPPTRHPDRDLRGRHFELIGDLAAGATVGSGLAKSEMVPISGMLRCRIRCEVSAGDGVLSAAFARPDAAGEFVITRLHTTNIPTPVAIASPNTEYVMEIDDLYGEAYLVVTFTDTTGGSTIARVSVSQL